MERLRRSFGGTTGGRWIFIRLCSLSDMEERDKKYKVMTSEDVKSYKKWVKETISAWHKVHPDYIFLNETSATPLGWMLKCAWAELYGKENMPKFYRINPRHDSVELSGYLFDEDFEYFKKRIRKKNSNIIVLDETGSQSWLHQVIKEGFMGDSFDVGGGSSVARAARHIGRTTWQDQYSGEKGHSVWMDITSPKGYNLYGGELRS